MGSQVPRVEPAIVAGARRGDSSAQGHLYEAFAPMVYTLARRMLVSPALAEDVLQETFVEVLRKLHTLRDEGGVGFWIRRIAVNKCLMYLRSGWHSRRVQTEAIESLCPPAQTPRADHQVALESGAGEIDGYRAGRGLAARRGGLHPQGDRRDDGPHYQFFQVATGPRPQAVAASCWMGRAPRMEKDHVPRH